MSSPKILIVGQAPGRRSKEPLDGASGKRLAALAGLDHQDFLSRFEHVSLLEQSAKAEFDVRAARDRADALREGWRGRKVVLLGRGVAAALRLVPDDYEWFQVLELPPGFEASVMPQPGGNSSWWNDPRNVEAARKFMLRLNLGLLARIDRRASARGSVGRKDQFTPEQVEAALIAADGLMTQAAAHLMEETGLNCARQTVANYCERYPVLGQVRDQLRQQLGDVAEGNVWREVRNGDADLSLRLLRCKMFAGRGYELMVEGKLKHEGVVDHRHAHLHASVDKLAGLGLDLARYSPEQLEAVRDFAALTNEAPPRDNGADDPRGGRGRGAAPRQAPTR